MSANAAVLSGIRAALGSLVLVAAIAQAPFQCASEVDPDRRLYEDPSEVLYALAGRFKEKGDPRAYAATLRYLIERYPSSRFSQMARDDLKTLGEPPPDKGD